MRKSLRLGCAKFKSKIVFEWEDTKLAAKEAWAFVKTHNWKKTARVSLRRKYWGWWLLLIVIVALSVTLSSYHHEIVEAMRPSVKIIGSSTWAWLIPFVLLIVVSFPPLMGHEIIMLLVGMIWGLGIGSAIGAAGTFVGELCTYYACKYFFRARAAKIEEKHVIYACIAKMMRNGGLPILVLVRFSAMPGHLVTAMQSTIGIGMWKYAVACFLTLPKQFSIVYIGYAYAQTGEKSTTGNQTADDYYHAQQTRISLIVFAVTTFATIIAAYIVWQKARRIRPQVLAEMEERRKSRSDVSPSGQIGSFGPVDVPLRLSLDEARLRETRQLHPLAFVRPELLRSPDSATNLLDSSWSINDTLGGRSRSSTINTRNGSRSRSGTLLKTPSLPDLAAYFEEAQYRRAETPALEGLVTITDNTQTSTPDSVQRHRRIQSMHT